MDLEKYSLIVVNLAKAADDINKFISRNSEDFLYKIDKLEELSKSMLRISPSELRRLLKHYRETTIEKLNNLNEIKKNSKILMKNLFVLHGYLLPELKRAFSEIDDLTVGDIIKHSLKELLFMSFPEQISEGEEILKIITEKIVETKKTFDELLFDSRDADILFRKNNFLSVARQYVMLFINNIVFSVFRVLLYRADPSESIQQAILDDFGSNLSQREKIKKYVLIKKFLNRIEPNYLLKKCKDGISNSLTQNLDASFGSVPMHEIFNGTLRKIFNKHPWTQDKITELMKIIIEKLIKDHFFVNLQADADNFVVNKYLFNENTLDYDGNENDDASDPGGWYDERENFTDQLKIELRNPENAANLDTHFMQPYQETYLKISNTFVRTFVKDFIEILLEKSYAENLNLFQNFETRVYEFEKFLMAFDYNDYINIKFPKELR